MQPSKHPVYADVALRSQLRRQLLSLPFDGFARVVAELLGRLGYRSVRSAGRTNFRGRNQHDGRASAGFDLAAVLPVPTIGSDARRLVIVALKQYPPETRVWQKQVDGLRGAALRVGASEALLITTSSFSPSVGEARDGGGAANPGGDAAAGAGSASGAVAPVRLVDGEALLSLLIANGVGVAKRSSIDPAKAALFGGDGDSIEDIGGEVTALDEAFFARIRELSAGNGPSDRFRAARSGEEDAGWQLTIDLSPRR